MGTLAVYAFIPRNVANSKLPRIQWNNQISIVREQPLGEEIKIGTIW